LRAQLQLGSLGGMHRHVGLLADHNLRRFSFQKVDPSRLPFTRSRCVGLCRVV
jgi:hypothetical protein